MNKTSETKSSNELIHEKLAADPDLADFDAETKQIGSPSHAELVKQIADLEDKLLRNQAETDNMRRRHERELSQAHKYSIERLARELPTVVDNLERALEQKGTLESAIFEGIELTLKGLLSVLEKFAIKPIDPLGQPFDPALHEAMGIQESIEHPANTVISVLQKGYQLHDRLLRPALVIVSKVQEQTK